MKLSTLNFTIDTHALTVTSIAGEVLNIRPKTCQLLIQLLEHQGTTLSKQQLLDSVWRDSVVAEQVVFQSINEIRQLFKGEEVIKTIPKKGYVWLPSVELQSEQAENQQDHKATKKALLQTLFALTFISLLGWLLLKLNTTAENNDPLQSVPLSGSIIVLPISNYIEGNDHSWIRLGMMDQVIQRLPSSQNKAVLRTDYVLEILERAQAPLNNIGQQHIKNIFTVSGAELVVASKLHGTVADYQLSYTLYHRHTQQKGVLFANTLQGLIDQYSSLLNKHLGRSEAISKNTYYQDFHNEMLGVAIDLRLEGKFEAAKPLLQSVIAKSPNNVTAQRIYIDTLFKLSEIELAVQQLAIALPIARERQQASELVRLMLYLAIYNHQSNNEQNALVIIEQALKIAAENNDWLHLANLTELAANIAMNKQDYIKAKALYKDAMRYHQVLHCPVGESTSWANLAILAERQGQFADSEDAKKHAFDIATKRHLTSQLAWLETMFKN